MAGEKQFRREKHKRLGRGRFLVLKLLERLTPQVGFCEGGATAAEDGRNCFAIAVFEDSKHTGALFGPLLFPHILKGERKLYTIGG